LFLAQKYIEHEIIGFYPAAADLDYPLKLNVGDVGSIRDLSTLMPYKRYNLSWYPTLERSLVCISKLYQTIDTGIFENISTEIIQECTESLLRASTIISAKSPLDGKLFLIRHLLILREEISPFEVNFLTTSSTLDFSHMRGAMRKILTVPRSLLAFSSENPLMAVVHPLIETRDVDSKKSLERELKTSIESIILLVTKTTIEPLLSFLTKVTAFKNVGARSPDSFTTSSIQSQPFASFDNVDKMLQDINLKMESDLPPLLKQICEYITNPSTQMILFFPIKDQISESLKELRNLIDIEYGSETKLKLIEHV